MESVGYYVRGLSAHNLFLHYLAETGLIGTPILIALFIRQFNLSRSIWKNEIARDATPFALILYLMGFLFLISTFIEAAWMWGQLGFTFVLFLAFIVRESNRRFTSATSSSPEAHGKSEP
jgi:O-antigen ligase